MNGETIAAVATAPGRAGVAVVRVSGPDAFSVAARVAGTVPEPGRFAFAVFRNPAAPAEALDSGLVLAFKSPRSYTGEDVVEFQCHGGAVAPKRVLAAAIAAGARLAHRGEFTERAFLNGRLDYTQAEAVIDLIDAKTERAADEALRGLGGGRTRAVRGLYADAVVLSSDVEHALDIDEGELPEQFFADLRKKFADLQARLEAEIARMKGGRILREGALVVLAGPPNAGKSSLMNALLGENRVLVSDIPGTTRDSIEEWLDIGGWPVRLVDTAGVRGGEGRGVGRGRGEGEGEGVGEGGGGGVDEIERAGIRRAKELIARADVVLELAAGSGVCRDIEPSDRQSVIRLSSKCDLARGPYLNVSSVTGEGLEELRGAIASCLEARAQGATDGGGDAMLAALVEARRLSGSYSDDLVLFGNALRSAAERLGSALGATYSQDLLDALFSRFCVGK